MAVSGNHCAVINCADDTVDDTVFCALARLN
jgi:hypothetical protein